LKEKAWILNLSWGDEREIFHVQADVFVAITPRPRSPTVIALSRRSGSARDKTFKTTTAHPAFRTSGNPYAASAWAALTWAKV
jgi:hypothetical protein